MTYTKEEIMQYMEEEDVKFIRLMFRDAFGVQKNISIMPTELKKAFEGGIGINARRIRGDRRAEGSSGCTATCAVLIVHLRKMTRA